MAPAAPPKTSEAVAARIRDAILRGDHQPGDRLPAERELAHSLGVGRSSVREAIAKLAQLGLVEIRHGGGATVRPVADANLEVLRHLLFLDGRLDLELVGEFMDVSEILLTASVRFAVVRATDEELARARELLDRLVDPKADDVEHFEALEALIQLMAEASRHRVLRLVRNGFRAILTDERRRLLRSQMRPPQEEIEGAVAELRKALDARDADAAVAAVLRFTRSTREQFLKRVAARDSG